MTNTAKYKLIEVLYELGAVSINQYKAYNGLIINDKYMEEKQKEEEMINKSEFRMTEKASNVLKKYNSKLLDFEKEMDEFKNSEIDSKANVLDNLLDIERLDIK